MAETKTGRFIAEISTTWRMLAEKGEILYTDMMDVLEARGIAGKVLSSLSGSQKGQFKFFDTEFTATLRLHQVISPMLELDFTIEEDEEEVVILGLLIDKLGNILDTKGNSMDLDEPVGYHIFMKLGIEYFKHRGFELPG